jgi:hypothetical protein
MYVAASMDLIERAIALLTETERSLRQLMAEGVESGSYAAIGQIANMAERLAMLKNGVVPTQSSDAITPALVEANGAKREADQGPGPPLSGAKRSVQRKSTSTRQSYPRFERNGDKLVKVGWSDRDQRAYEHRAPRAIVFQVCEALARRSARGRRFRMEEVLPELGELKDPIPSYQGYLTLAWLRSEGVIDRDGKDGYRVKNGALSDERIEKLWESLAERSS